MASNTAAFRFKLRRDIAADWLSINPVLADGEPGVETDTRKLKVGDGVTAWNALGYIDAAGDADPTGLVTGSGITAIVALSQSAYNALGSKNSTTLYVITG